jgi:hypothetical protein
VSLSQEPVFSELKNKFVCTSKDITNEPYCGKSGRHAPTGKGISTTNGAGPHNLQLFVLAPDGTVLHCLPGYWAPQDLVHELKLAEDLFTVWKNPQLSRGQKNQMFKQMQLSHLNEHPTDMVRRSRMQGFDQKFEAKNRPYQSDTVKNPQLAVQALAQNNNKLLAQAFKTTDQIAHERMAQRPFVPYSQFDVAVYTDYGKQRYEKNEDFRDMSGQLVMNPKTGEAIPPGQRKMQKRSGVQNFQGGRMRRMRNNMLSNGSL